METEAKSKELSFETHGNRFTGAITLRWLPDGLRNVRVAVQFKTHDGEVVAYDEGSEKLVANPFGILDLNGTHPFERLDDGFISYKLLPEAVISQIERFDLISRSERDGALKQLDAIRRQPWQKTALVSGDESKRSR